MFPKLLHLSNPDRTLEHAPLSLADLQAAPVGTELLDRYTAADHPITFRKVADSDHGGKWTAGGSTQSYGAALVLFIPYRAI